MLCHGLLYVGKGNLPFIQEQIDKHQPDSWKGYNISNSAKVDDDPKSLMRQWRHDDAEVAYPTFELIQKTYDKLKDKKVGIQAGAPAGDYVAKAGLMPKAKPYLFIVDTRYENPMEEMIKDLRAGEIDVAILWGPYAGYYANKGEGDKLTIVPMLENVPGLPKLEYRITMGVRANEANWKRQINEVIAKRQGDIDAVLLEYGVPLIDEENKLITAARRPSN